ncbi:MAG: acyl-CoA dehydrogenase family protein [Sphingorhabdus sp.]
MSVTEILLDQVVRLYADAQNGRRDESGDCDPALWSKVEELGLPLAMCPQSSGGFELCWSEIFDVLSHSAACGEYVPLGDTLVSNLLLCEGDAAPAEGPVFLASPSGYFGGETVSALSGKARVLTATGASVALGPVEASPCGGIANFAPGDDRVTQVGALLRAIQIAGALQGALDLSVRYAQERIQFGRALSKQQAVQHMLAQLAGEAVATAAAARMACARIDAGDGRLAVAIAKLRAGRAVEKGAMLAHQIHGAIGITMEYPLARLSRSMWTWSEEFGGQRYWAIEIGRAAVKAKCAWDTIIDASDPVGETNT